MSLLIKGGRLIDPASNTDSKLDILIKGTKISSLGKNLNVKDATRTIDAQGKVVIPGLIDLHAHLRQPGREDKETIETASYAAAKGGFTTVLAMPNTNPVADNEGVIEFIISLNQKVGMINILPVAALTRGLRGEELSEVGQLQDAGAVALSDDGESVENSFILRKAMEYASMFNLPVISHCEDKDLSSGGVINEGYFSTILGLKAQPAIAESVMLARDLRIAQMTKVRLHIAHVTTAESVKLLSEAKRKNILVTAETCPHYFTLTDEAVVSFDTNLKVNPPLRSKEDREAIKKGLKDGTIDIIATDHAPHTEAEKDVEFDYAPFGMIGLETAFSLGLSELVSKDILSLAGLVEKMSLNPAKFLNLSNKGRLSLGCDADIVIVDLESEWTVEKDKIKSKSKNTPFIGWKLKGVIEQTICAGKEVYSRV